MSKNASLFELDKSFTQPESDECHNDLPDGWKHTTLGDIASRIQYGYTASATSELVGPHLLRITDIQDGKVNWTTVPFCNISKSDTEKFRLIAGDIVFARTGATTGKSFLLGELPESVFASYLIRVQLLPTATPEFLSYFFQTHSYWEQISDKLSGIGQPNCNASKLASVKLPLPPLEEQRRIVAQIEALLARVNVARERLAHVPQVMRRFRQSVLAAACSGRLTADWRESQTDLESASALLARIREERKAREGKKYREPIAPETTDLPELPEGWVWIMLPELGELNRGKSKHRPRNAPHLYGGVYPFVQTGDIARSGGRIRSHRQTYSDAGLVQSRLWPERTICITIAANIADSALLTYPACFPDSVVGLVTDTLLCTPEFAEYFIRTAKSDLSAYAPATAQKNINLDILSKVAFPLPPLAEQEEIVRRVETLFALADAIEKRVASATARADKTIQAVLAKAFRDDL